MSMIDTARRTSFSTALRAFGGLLLAALLTVGLAGCGAEKVTDEDRQQLEATLREYLPLLSEAYDSGNIEPLRGLAAEREMARIHKRVSELADEGKVVEPTFRQLTVEDVQIWNHSNAFVTTVEVWDLRVFPIGSSTVLSEELNQSNRVKYQLKREGGEWQVLARELEQTLE